MKVFELLGEVYRKDSNSEQSEHGQLDGSVSKGDHR